MVFSVRLLRLSSLSCAFMFAPFAAGHTHEKGEMYNFAVQLHTDAGPGRAIGGLRFVSYSPFLRSLN